MPSLTRMTREQALVLAVCVAIFALGQFHRASGSVFTPILMERYAYSAATIGGLVSAMFFASIAAQLPFGAVLDRIGPRPVLTGCIALIAVGGALFALADAFGAALAARVLIGLGSASMGAASHIIIARNFPKAEFGYVSGLVVTLGSVGGILGTYPLAAALTRLPWEGVFGAVAALTAILAVFVFRVTGRQPPPVREASTGGYRDLLKLLALRRILVLALVTFAPITAIAGLWGGPFLQNAVGLSAEGAGLALSSMFACTLAAAYIFGVLDRRLPSRRLLILCGAGASAACLFGLAFIPNLPPWAAIGLLLGMVFCQQFYIPLGAHMRMIAPDALLGRASSLFNLVAVAAIPLMQVAIGAILDLAAGAGLGAEAQFRWVFGAMGGLISLCALVYATGPREA